LWGVVLLVVSTMLLPYAQTVFGEWLATIGLLLAVLSWVQLETQTQTRPWLPALGMGVGAALAVGANLVYLLLAALLGLLLLWQLWPRLQKNWPRYIAPVAAFALPLLLLGLGLLAYNAARFGNPFTTGYRLTPGQEGFTTPLWWGALGLLVSPARGLIWYAPPVLLALGGAMPFYRRAPRLSGLLTAVCLFHLTLFGLWWEWWGGYGWGPRFLLPLVPLLLLMGLPVVQAAADGSRWSQVAVVSVLVLGTAVQVAGVAINSNDYEQELDALHPAPADQFLWYHHDPALVYDVGASPLVWHWREILGGTRPWQTGWWSAVPLPARDLRQQIAAESQPGDVVLSLAPELQPALLESAPQLPPVYGLPINLPAADALAQALFAHATADAERVWLVTWYGAGDTNNFYEAQLRQTWGSVRDEWVGEWRVVLLASPPEELVAHEVTAEFGEIGLRGVNTAVDDDNNQLFVQLSWQLDSPPPPDLVSFVHLVDADGQLIAQQDRPLLAGYPPASSLITDQFAFTLPENSDPSQLSLRLGWYQWPSLDPLGEAVEVALD
ncbi:MAG: hypothetical protein KDD89_09595, partial [Anaerolineales bacterium]|nr:hypothetical protein [Anaerolineales bacterium]